MDTRHWSTAKGPAGIALYAVVSLILGSGAAYWMVTSMLDSIGGPPELASAGVMLTWTDARAGEEKKRKRKDRVVTKDDRRAFADDLARQLKGSRRSQPGRESLNRR